MLPLLFITLILFISKVDSVLMRFGISKLVLICGLFVVLVVCVGIDYKKIVFTKKIYYIGILLLYFLFQFIISGGYNNGLANYITLANALLLFVYFDINKAFINQYIHYFFIGWLMILCVQTLLITRIVDGEVLGHFARKNLYLLPIGGSNYIAAIIVLLVCIVTYLKQKFHPMLYMFVQIMACMSVYFLRSRASLIVLATFYFIYFVVNKLHINKAKAKKILKFSALSVAIIIPLVLFVAYIRSGGDYQNHSNFLDKISTGRFQIYVQNMKHIFSNVQYILFGYGFRYGAVASTLPHDIIQTVVIYGGFVALVVHGFIFVKFKKLLLNSIHKKMITIFVAIILFQGLFEPTLYSHYYDIFVVVILAYLMQDVNDVVQFSFKKSKILIALLVVVLSGSWLYFKKESNVYQFNITYQVEMNLKDHYNELVEKHPQIKIDETEFVVANIGERSTINALIISDLKQNDHVKQLSQSALDKITILPQVGDIVDSEKLVVSIREDAQHQRNKIESYINDINSYLAQRQDFVVSKQRFRIKNYRISELQYYHTHLDISLYEMMISCLFGGVVAFYLMSGGKKHE